MSAWRTAASLLQLPTIRTLIVDTSPGFAKGWHTQLCTSGHMPILSCCRGAQIRALATSAAVSGRRGVSITTNLKQLCKLRLSSLVVLTASAGFAMGSGTSVDWRGLLWTSLGTFGCAACANALNQIYEVANDSMMTRTANRPLPAGRMTKVQAALFAVAAAAMGLGTLHYQTNDVTTALGAFNIFLYAGVYTPLKQISPVNTWIGAVVGAVPPLMGWTSATHGQVDPGAWVLAAALFFWQLPHFLALAWLCKDDYIRGGFKMISAFDRTGSRTAAAALRNAVYLLPLGALAYGTGITTEPFAWEAVGLGALLLLPAARFYISPSQKSARKLFKSSLLYLPLSLGCMVLHRQPRSEDLKGYQTLGEQFQTALRRATDVLAPGPPGDLVPHFALAVERTGLAAVRVFGGSDAAAWFVLRCPSTVHSDDGQRPSPRGVPLLSGVQRSHAPAHVTSHVTGAEGHDNEETPITFKTCPSSHGASKGAWRHDVDLR